MVTPEIIKYAKGLREQGHDDIQITEELTQSGLLEADITAVFAGLDNSEVLPPPPQPVTQPQTLPDVPTVQEPLVEQLDVVQTVPQPEVVPVPPQAQEEIPRPVVKQDIPHPEVVSEVVDGIPIPQPAFDVSETGKAVPKPSFKRAFNETFRNLLLYGGVIFLALLPSFFATLFILYTNLILGTSFVILTAAVSFVANIVAIFGALALIIVIANSGSGITIGVVYQKALSLFKSYFWILILVGLATMGGSLLLIVPGIIVSILLLFTPYVLVVEGKTGMNALMQSRMYIRGRKKTIFYEVFGFGLAVGFIYIVLSWIVIFGVELALNPYSQPILYYGVNSTVTFVLGGLFQIMTGVFIYDLYNYTKHQKLIEVDGDRDSAKRKYKRLMWVALTIPILGILASLILASLSSARMKVLSVEAELDSSLNVAPSMPVPLIYDEF